MQQTSIFLIRHGEVEWQIHPEKGKLIYGPEVSLSDLGKSNIKKLGLLLKEEMISHIYVSPFVRTRQTAKVLSEVWGYTPIVTRENLRDVDIPGWLHQPWSELEKINYDVYNNPRSKDQETLENVSKRMLSDLEVILEEQKGKNIAIVSHGDPLSLLAYILLNPVDTHPQRNAFDSIYLERGQALKLVLDPKRHVIQQKLFRL